MVCQTKAHHIVVPFVMASRLLSNNYNDLPRLTVYRVSFRVSQARVRAKNLPKAKVGSLEAAYVTRF